MEKPIMIPELGDEIKEVKIVEWLVKKGDIVKKGETVAILETEKVAFEIESPESGIIKSLEYSEGDKVNISKPIAYIDYSEDMITSNNKSQMEQEKSKNVMDVETSKKSIRNIFKRIIKY